jgi:hypothetical protein
MGARELRRKIGDERFEEIAELVKKLKAKGKSPDQIARAVRRKYPDVVESVMAYAFTPIWILMP